MSQSETIIKFLIIYLVRFFFSTVLVYTCYVAIANYNYWFSWHVILCTFGRNVRNISPPPKISPSAYFGPKNKYVPLMAESIMMFLGHDIWSKETTRTNKYMIHGILISLSTAIIIAGNALVFHYLEPGFHLYTEHGITGLVSMIFLIISLFSGMTIQYYKQLKDFLQIGVIWFKLIHNLTGLLGFVVGIVSLGYGFYTNWFVFYTASGTRTVLLTFTIVSSLWAIYGALLSAKHQISTTFSILTEASSS